MKKFFLNKNFINVLSMFIFMISIYGANTRCAMILHTVEKNSSLDKLKKY